MWFIITVLLSMETLVSAFFPFGGEKHHERIRSSFAAQSSLPGIAAQNFVTNHVVTHTDSWYYRQQSFLAICLVLMSCLSACIRNQFIHFFLGGVVCRLMI
jgi:hypothetical protein